MIHRLGFAIPLVLAGCYWFMTERIPHLAFGDPLGPRVFPRLVAAGLVLSALMWFFELRSAAGVPAEASAHEDNNHFRAVGGVGALLVAYVVLILPLGFILTTVVFLFTLTSFFHRGKHVTNVLVAVLFPVATYLLFTRVLGVHLPSGYLLPI